MNFLPPGTSHVKDHQEILTVYLNNQVDIKSRLKTILDKMNSKTIVVLTCNHGQSELLLNFVCSSKARGFDLSNVLVFPTDIETKELAEGMGLATFYEEKIMASVPKNEANYYGDKIFTRVMFAKVVCVQLVNELGKDLLFQDGTRFAVFSFGLRLLSFTSIRLPSQRLHSRRCMVPEPS